MIYKPPLLRLAYACLALPLMLHSGACYGELFSCLPCLPCLKSNAYCDDFCDSMVSSRMTGKAFLFRYPCQNCNDLRLNLCDPLVTDRPWFTNASQTVGRGVTQLEFGYSYITDDDTSGNTDLHSLPELLIRRGFYRDWLELRLGYSAATGDLNGTAVSGSRDLYLGMKLGLTAQRGYLPQMALMPQMLVPTGDSSLTSDKTLGGLNWLYSWDVNRSLQIGGSTQFNRAIDDVSAVQYTEWAQSIVAKKQLTRTFRVYAEWFALIPNGATSNRTENYIDGGFTKLFSRNVQWDVRAGAGLNDEADDFFVGTGLSIRFL